MGEVLTAEMTRWRSLSCLNGDCTSKGSVTRLSSSSMLDERFHGPLQRHYRLLMTHITLTDDVIDQMAKEKILPMTMIKDIQSGETREEKNERLLNAIRLRGNKCFKRFRELMYRVGNFFVADLLWEEGDNEGLVGERELAVFPGLLAGLHDSHRKKLIHYLDSKIREKALQLAWRDHPEERLEVLGSRAADFSQEKTLRDTIASQQRQIKELEENVGKEEETARDLRLDLSAQHHTVAQLKRDHRISLDTQTRFHDANLSTITRLREKLVRSKRGVTDLNDMVKSRMDILMPDDSDTAADNPEDDVKVCVLERNVRYMLNRLKHVEERAQKGDDERQDVLRLLNRRYSKEPLSVVVKEVLKHEQKHRSVVMRDILRLLDAFKQAVGATMSAPNFNIPTTNTTTVTTTTTTAAGAAAASSGGSAVGATCDGSAMVRSEKLDPSTLDTKHFKSLLAMLRAEVEHVGKRFQWKDQELASQRQQIADLAQQLQDLTFLSQPDTTLAPSAASLNSSGGSSPPSRRSPERPTNTPNIVTPTCHTPVSPLDGHSPNCPHHLPTSPDPDPPLRKKSRSPSRRSSAASTKTVTFKDTARQQEARNSASCGGGGGGGDGDGSVSNGEGSGGGDAGGEWRAKVDLDQTVVNVEKYLEEEEEGGTTHLSPTPYRASPTAPPPSRDHH